MYTGDVPRFGVRGKADVLVTLQVGVLHQHATATQATIHHLQENVRENQTLLPSAAQAGSSVVYHSPILEDRNLSIDLRMDFDTFDGSNVKSVASLAQEAGALPLFAPASGFLLAGGILLKAFADLATALGKSSRQYKTEPLYFQGPNPNRQGAGYLVFHEGEDLDYYKAKWSRNAADECELVVYHPTSGEIYQGDRSYVVVSVDGAERPELADFQVKKAAAEQLQRFQDTESTTKATTDFLLDAIRLIQDKAYYEQALELQSKLDGEIPDDERQPLKEQLHRYKDNIVNDVFKDLL